MAHRDNVAHHRRGAIIWELVRQMLPGLLAGALLGTVIADAIGNTALGIVFGIFALLVGLQMLRGVRHVSQHPMPGRMAIAGTGLVISTLSSLRGIGGGSMTVPWLLWHGPLASAGLHVVRRGPLRKGAPHG